MSLATPKRIQELRRKRYRKAKQEKEFRFHTLYDKVYREDVLEFAWRLCRANGGAPGVYGQTFRDIESYGVEPWLQELSEEVRTGRYRPVPVRIFGELGVLSVRKLPRRRYANAL